MEADSLVDGCLRLANADIYYLEVRSEPCSQLLRVGHPLRYLLYFPHLSCLPRCIRNHKQVCLLHSICENGDDLFKLNTTDMFRCKFSTSRFYALKDKLTMQPAKPEERPEGDAFCTRNVDYIEDPNTKQVVAKTNGIAVATYEARHI